MLLEGGFTLCLSNLVYNRFSNSQLSNEHHLPPPDTRHSLIPPATSWHHLPWSANCLTQLGTTWYHLPPPDTTWYYLTQPDIRWTPPATTWYQTAWFHLPPADTTCHHLLPTRHHLEPLDTICNHLPPPATTSYQSNPTPVTTKYLVVNT